MLASIHPRASQMFYEQQQQQIAFSKMVLADEREIVCRHTTILFDFVLELRIVSKRTIHRYTSSK